MGITTHREAAMTEPSRFDPLFQEEGQDLAEYAVLIGLIALVVVGAVTVFGGQLAAFYNWIVATLPFDVS